MTTIPISPATGEPVTETAPTADNVTVLRAYAQADALTPTSTPRLNRTAVAAVLVPPDIWHENRPSLRSMWLYAVCGQWTGPRTPARYAGVAYGVLASIITGLVYLLLWIVERPSRLAIALLITILTILAL